MQNTYSVETKLIIHLNSLFVITSLKLNNYNLSITLLEIYTYFSLLHNFIMVLQNKWKQSQDHCNLKAWS